MEAGSGRRELHLECLVVQRVDGVPLDAGLPFALTGFIRQQVTFDVTEKQPGNKRLSNGATLHHGHVFLTEFLQHTS